MIEHETKLYYHGYSFAQTTSRGARGGGTGKKLENHVRENIGWILFKTRNFYTFLDIQ